ncbi:MAG: hypothetical protein ABIT37_00480 [Luteolibacter sp.]
MTRTHGTLLAGAAILTTAVVMISREARTPAATTPSEVRSTSEKSVPAPEVSLSKNPRRPPSTTRSDLPELPQPVESPYQPGAAGGEEWIASRTAELDRLAWFDDTESLHKILAELRNPLPEIRAAALTATLAFSGRESIPYLEMIARETRDPQEQKALTDAVEHLKLPTMVEELEREESQPAPPETDAQ